MTNEITVRMTETSTRTRDADSIMVSPNCVRRVVSVPGNPVIVGYRATRKRGPCRLWHTLNAVCGARLQPVLRGKGRVFLPALPVRQAQNGPLASETLRVIGNTGIVRCTLRHAPPTWTFWLRLGIQTLRRRILRRLVSRVNLGVSVADLRLVDALNSLLCHDSSLRNIRIRNNLLRDIVVRCVRLN